ncbi:MAG TPA: amino acid adenylation domain-containing protein, partial [Thermoanaerobaculia bacterium]|nr:amino acid adenylation domain-containing protein [Thermoanaerobaculia bacterium]
LELPVTDLRSLPEIVRDAQAERWIAAEVARPFDLEKGPLLRLSLLRLADDEWLLAANMHHIVSDGWSMEVLVHETGALYAAFARNLPSPLPELAIQYADFADWQRRWLAGEVLETQLSYWRQELAGAPALLELPTDRPRPPAQSVRGAVEPLALPAALSRDLQALARREGATLFMILLAAFQTLLHRLAGQDDVLVGSPVANRNRGEIEGLIGFFVNTLVLRGRFGTPDRAPSFREAVARTRVAALGAYAHQDLPFERLVEELQVERSLSYSPLFQVMFTLQSFSLESLELPGLRLAPVPMQGVTAKFDLTLSMAEAESGLAGTLEYSSELFDAATMRRLLDHLRTLLEGAAAEPAHPVSELPLLGAAERFQLTTEWNDTARTRSSSPLVHELVAAQARLRPEATAVVSEQGRLSYRNLVERAHRLAHRLRSLGVGPEVRVAVCLERSPERVIAALGVLAAGGSFVSLDPGYPPERLAFLLTDSRSSVLLTGTRIREALPDTGAVVLCLDADPDPVAGGDAAPPESGVTPANPAYVIYTSGSTGWPKGIEVPHAGLLNLVNWHVETYGVTPDDRAAQVASPAFDASVWELWPYLAAGAELHIPDETTRLSAPATLRWWTEAGITLTFLPTPLAEAVLEEPAPPDLALRALLIGGDRLHRAPGPEWPFRLVNHYGPAECSVVTTAAEVSPDPGSAGVAPPIGRAIDGARVHVLDRAGEPVPVGVPGELHIGGAGLARGYLERPDLTAAAFLPDNMDGVPGARLYRTGDRVRWRPDGQLDFLGRLDHQVKVRGVRIELGEIEAVLSGHPGVREAIVVARETRPGHVSLAACVVADEPAPVAGELRVFLQEQLPEAMVPASFLFIDALPLTPNGKVDRQALALLVPDVGDEEVPFVLPRDPVEEILAGIWSDLLQRERIGIHDDFFALGGHSLLATRVISQVHDAFGTEIPLRSLFEAPTVAGFAAMVEAARAEASDLPALPIEPRHRLTPPHLSFAQERLWFLDQLDAGTSTYSVPLAVRLTGALDPPLFAAC